MRHQADGRLQQGLSLGDALHRCHELDDQGLYWLEEPIAYDNLAGYAQLTRELKTPIQLGENFYGPRALFQAVSADAGKYMMPDLMRIGGVTGWLRAAAIAGAAGIELSTHLYPEVSAHLMRVTETAHWLEWQDWADPFSRAVQVRRRQLVFPISRQRRRVERKAINCVPARRLNVANAATMWRCRGTIPHYPGNPRRRSGVTPPQAIGGVT